MLTFLILGIVVNWCHYFTNLTNVGGKCITAGSVSKLFYFALNLCILFYSSYIFRSRLRTTRQTTSSTTSSIAPEETRSAAILCTTPEEEARLAVILGTTKCQCLHVFTLDLWSCLWMLYCVCMWWILWSLNECVRYCDLWMNVLDLNVYMDVLYIMCAMCRFCNSNCTVFCKKN
jgi:hypothetical protein